MRRIADGIGVPFGARLPQAGIGLVVGSERDGREVAVIDQVVPVWLPNVPSTLILQDLPPLPSTCSSPQATVAELADLPEEPRRPDRVRGFLHRPNHHLARAPRLPDSLARSPPCRSSQRDEQPDQAADLHGPRPSSRPLDGLERKAVFCEILVQRQARGDGLRIARSVRNGSGRRIGSRSSQ